MIQIPTFLWLGLMAAALDAMASDWPTSQGDATRSGVASEELSGRFVNAWPGGIDVGHLGAAGPIVADGRLWYGTWGGQVQARDPESGTLLTTSGPDDRVGVTIRSTPAYCDGMIVFGSMDGYVNALDVSDTANRTWRFQTDGGVCADVLIANGVVYVGSMDGCLYALKLVPSSRKGELLWKAKTGCWIQRGAARAGELILSGSGDGAIHAFRVSDGSEAWQFKTAREVRCTPTTDDRRVYFGSDDKTFYALDLKTGSRIWSHATAGYVTCSAALFADAVVFGSDDGKLRALKKETGEMVWEFDAGAPISAGPIIAAERLCFGSEGGKFFILDAATGKSIDTLSAAGEIAYPAACAGGRIYFFSASTLYAIEDATQLEQYQQQQAAADLALKTAEALLKEGRKTETVTAFNGYLTVAAKLPLRFRRPEAEGSARSTLATLEAGRKFEEASRAPERYQDAACYLFASNKPNEAFALLENAAKELKEPDAWIEYGRWAVRRNEWHRVKSAAEALGAAQRKEQAEAFRTIHALAPKQPKEMPDVMNLALAIFKAGLPDAALQYLELTSKVNPDPEVHYWRGRALEALDCIGSDAGLPLARADYCRYLEKAPQGQFATDAATRLNAAEPLATAFRFPGDSLLGPALKQAGTMHWITSEKTYQDFVFKARVTIRGRHGSQLGGSFGLCFRLDEQGHGGVFALKEHSPTFRSAGYYEGDCCHPGLGVQTAPRKLIASAFSLDEAHDLEVRCRGNEVRCLLDGSEIMRKVDARPVSGKVGIRWEGWHGNLSGIELIPIRAREGKEE